ncbi:S-layer homology domain-containing protein [Paenibacillus xylaniclasticus]|uniref:S-layer homology domain-containing protein n=1 Tax=Paenibacillus xylaniclasticus TaxID=588083 RepID=UPI000FDAF0B3|nr:MULTISPECIES: S-layer homology domain-containing protein [Paenibacillus]GFN32674.1 hypothetical protein PCURB6_29340 [Paenibacillus curdlanolyticus]
MAKKCGIWFVVLSLLIGLLQFAGSEQVTAATSGNFSFPSEFDKPENARVTSNGMVTITGTLNGVDPSTVSYSVLQITDPNDPKQNENNSKRENLTSNIYINGNTIQVFNVQLFSGLNEIKFQGVKGGGIVENSIYIDYHDGPTLYDLEASLYGNSFPLNESTTTVVHSTATKGKSQTDISISGKAPNAQSVTVEVNGKSRTFSVNSTNNYSFIASPVTVQKGKNLIKITVGNGTQKIETTREVAFYNGSVTFYDMSLTDASSNKVSLEYSPSLVTDKNGTLTVTGRVIVPNFYGKVGSEIADAPHPNPTLALQSLKGEIFAQGSATPVLTFDNTTITSAAVQPYDVKDAFFVYDLTFNLDGSQLLYNQRYNVRMQANNEVNIANGTTPTVEGTNALNFTLVDSSTPYIEQVNYLPGYEPGNYLGLTGDELEGKSLYGMPIGVEVIIGNYSNMDTSGGLGGSGLYIDQITNSAGKSATTGYTTTVLNQSDEVLTINGKTGSYRRIILEVSKLPFEGKQTIQFSVKSSTSGTSVTHKVTVTMLFGPYVSYTKLYDTMQYKYDTTSSNVAYDLINVTLDMFAGEIQNVNNTDEIRYKPDANGAQSIYFYVNNVAFPLVQKNAADAHDTKFTLDSSVNINDVFAVMFSGENKIRFVFQGTSTFYERTVKLNLIPTNLPVIPVEGSSGVFPFTYVPTVSDSEIVPTPNDPNFPLSGSIYTTSKSKMNIHGTFDFIDLGQSMTEADIKANMPATPSDYILKISSSTSKEYEWNLSQPFVVVNSDDPSASMIYDPDNKGISGLLVVRYDVKEQTFSFILKEQELNSDGSSSVYNFYVYNSGIYGPKASYRLEVDPTALPYDIVRPILPAKSIVNQNFVEVVIDAKGAESVVINKTEAVKSQFDADYDGTIDYYNAYRAIITDLKVGKNTIKFTITSANDKTSGSFDITYAPTNIPGAQYMKQMSNSQKVFDGALTLTFPKGTTLVRSDYNVPAEFKNQVFTNHTLLYSIANSEDGVVDRHEFDGWPADFDKIITSYGEQFKFSFPSRFMKASPVYWIDAGLADDTTTKSLYDPLTYGAEPYQFPNSGIPSYNDRASDRELVASKSGKLTLSFDPNMKDAVGTLITVYRYDNQNKYWENLGGVVDTKKNTITVPFTKFGYYVAAKMVYSFSDITGHPYARNYMESIYSKGISNSIGYEDFGADMYTTRGEFARMIVKALDIPLNYELGNPSFDDVPQIVNPDAIWDYRYIETAAREGIIRGTQPRTFDPSGNITREEAAVILARALELKLATDPDKIAADLEKQFKDHGNINYYAKASVAAIAKKGYIKGSPVDTKDPKKGYVFEPRSNLLRSDAAIIVGKMMADLKKLPKLN